MTVSDRDRRYMERLGAYKAESHAEAVARHRALPLAERLRASWRLFRSRRGTARLERREDDPTGFYDRARARGLYRDA